MMCKIFKKLFPSKNGDSLNNGNPDNNPDTGSPDGNNLAHSPQNKRFFKKADFILAALLATACFALYWYTLAPTVYSGDSGEITAAVYETGVAHSTGFPLYMILGKFFTALFFFGKNFAYKLNLFSALCGSSIVAIMYFAFRRVLSWHFSTEAEVALPPWLKKNTAQMILAAIVCLTLGFSLTLWKHSIAAKTYTLAAAMVALQILAMLYWYETRKDKYIYLYALALGFGLCTHLTGGISSVAFLALVFFTDKSVFKKKKVILKALLIMLAPLLLYLYIPWAAKRDPYVNQDNPENLKNFIYYITQRDYAFKMGDRSISGYIKVMLEVLKFYVIEFTFLGLALALTGLIAFWKKYKALFYSFFVLMAVNLMLLMSYGNERDFFILFRYFLPSYLLLSILILLGLSYILTLLSKLKSAKIKIPILFFIALFPLAPLIANYPVNNQSNNYIVEIYGRNLLDSLPQDSILFTFGDAVTGPLWYLRGLGTRPDVLIVDLALITHEWYIEQLSERWPETIPLEFKDLSPQDRFKNVVERNIGKRPIYSSLNSDDSIKEKYQYVPYGLINEILAVGAKPNIDEYKVENKKLWDMYDYAGLSDEKIYKGYMIKEIVGQYAKAHNNLAVYYSGLDDKDAARQELHEALKYDANNFSALYNLSGYYKKEGNEAKAAEYMALAEKVNPDYFKSAPQEVKNYEPAIDTPKTSHPASVLRKDTAVEGYLRQATEYGKKGMHIQAIGVLEKAKKIDPENEIVRYNLATAYALTKQFLKAVAEFEKVCEINPNSSPARYNLGTIYLNELKDEEKAIGHFQQFVELEPDDSRVGQIQQLILQLVKNKMNK
ncbi:DUF2723 domain-containing protein [Patescibacteria group bacterium]|nr:DUF2723 domain-containing protein [Patescibacteria group bacterium]